ncbi:MAG: transketolase [Rickettsiaceae bacterium]|jgi:transketolase|nr:transketolase [Rickettsiaceae bacterium]
MKNISLLNLLSNCIRLLSAEAVEKAKSGHPGMPLGMSDVLTILMLDFLKFNPSDAKWFNRDRLVLSAGHGSMALYSLLYLTGYKDFTLEDIKNFRQLNSKAAGHPERELHPAIETTTGPLGQGFANSVGMAIAEKKYKAELGTEVADYKIYCIAGDGCLMEGISYEAASIAGHLKLDNLIVLFDDNEITIDGPTSLTISENQLAKFEALGWNTISINGHDFNEIYEALAKAQNSDKPYLIACKTKIGFGAPNKVGSESAHGSPLGAEEFAALKTYLNWLHQDFELPKDLLDAWRAAWLRNKEAYDKWQHRFNGLNKESIDFCKDFSFHEAIVTTFKKILEEQKISEPTRNSSGRVVDYLMDCKKIIIGSADLSISNNLKNKKCKAINRDDFSGNYLHYGPREAAMGAIMNGLALSGFKTIGGTFLVFSDYMRPTIRLAALMQIPVIYIFTHDSIGVGEDGPTHQPIEHLASLRAIPNLNVLRPADIVETVECWDIALKSKHTPTLLALTRQKLPQLRGWSSSFNECKKGAYVISQSTITNAQEVKVTIFATGSEVSLALEVQKLLEDNNFSTRVVSVPCLELFFKQPKDYIDNVIGNPTLRVAIEAACSFGWHKVIGEKGLFFGLDHFGASAPFEALMKHFGLEAQQIADKIRQYLAIYAI